MSGVWTTTELDAIEYGLLDLTYVDAFLLLTFDLEIPFKVAIDWLDQLAKKEPTSRLGRHVEASNACLRRSVG